MMQRKKVHIMTFGCQMNVHDSRRIEEVLEAAGWEATDEATLADLVLESGADLLFQVISQRYERGSIVLTTNQAYKHWPKVFNNDSTLTSALLDRLLHHAESVVIEARSYRMRDHIET